MIRWIALLLATLPPPGPGAHESPAIVASAAWVVIPTSELVAAYDTVWAISDVHGRLAELENLLLAAKLAVRTPSGALEWNRAASRQLLVVVGDCIDGGEDSVGVVLLLKTLQEQSAASRSRVVVLLGNHEVAFLADPASATAELIASATRAGLGPRSGLTSSQLYESEFGRYLKRLPAGAVIGTWLFAHAGYIDAEPDRLALRAWFAKVGGELAGGGTRAYAGLSERTSITDYHRWWTDARRLRKMRAILQVLGLTGLLIGHDPDALGAPRSIAINREGWLLKLDAGLKSGRTPGLLLRCSTADVLRDGSLAMATAGRPNCSSLSPRAPEAIAVR